jgi:SAM-dependent methyltransferase
MSAPRELHDLDPTGRFSNRAEDYRRFRPDYPSAAIDAIVEGLGDPARLVAADVGAGTGISARQLATRGVRMRAIEPNAEMRAAATPDPRVEFLDGTAEATGLPAASVDLVVSAQAFHWFRPAEALAEFHRILRPAGRLALMWNNRDRRDPLTLGYTEAILAVEGEDPIERRQFDPSVIAASGFFPSARVERFQHRQVLDRAGLIGRAMSASYVPREGPRADALRAQLADLFRRHEDAAGTIALRYTTTVFLTERPAAGAAPGSRIP